MYVVRCNWNHMLWLVFIGTGFELHSVWMIWIMKIATVNQIQFIIANVKPTYGFKAFVHFDVKSLNSKWFRWCEKRVVPRRVFVNRFTSEFESMACQRRFTPQNGWKRTIPTICTFEWIYIRFQHTVKCAKRKKRNEMSKPLPKECHKWQR